jgi:lipoprotein-anchoring transpeptidase ErfK/SrfK
MVLRISIAVTTLISMTALVNPAGAQYVSNGQPSLPRPYAAIPDGRVPGQDETHPDYGSLPPEDQPETDAKGLPPEFHRQLVNYQTTEPAGTIIIDTPHTYLYLVLGPGRALRYGVGVGREGFTWAGTQRIARMVEWPDWHPPPEMIDRQPCRDSWQAVRAIHLAHGRSTLAIRSTASMARISPRPSVSLFRPAAFVCSTRISKTCITE